MYATSKLIIPPKPARDTPFIPKLRIRLRHSPSSHCGARDQVYNVAHNESPHLIGNFGDHDSFHTNIESLVGVCSISMLRNTAQKGPHPNSFAKLSKSRQRQLSSFTSGCTIRRATSKRKQSSAFVDTLDLENPDSLLTKVNLKLLINRETFYSLPLDVQQMLSQLLPLFDHCREMSLNNSVLIDENDYSPSLSLSSGIESSEQSNTVWLHPTALNNEFFTKALQDFSDRQAKGEFTPRIRNRAGLRAHVGNRYRYTSSSDMLQSNTNNNKKKTFVHEIRTKKSSGQTNSRRSSRSKPKNFNCSAPNNDFHHPSLFTNSPPVDTSLISSTLSVSGSSVKNSQSKRNRSTRPSYLQSDGNNESMVVCSPSTIQLRERLKEKSECSMESNDIEFEGSIENKTSDLSELCTFPLDDTLNNSIPSSGKSFYPADLENSEFTDSVCCLSDRNRDDRSLSLSPAYNGPLVSPSSVGDSNKGLKLCDKTLESEDLKLTDSPNTKPTHARRLSLDSKLVNPSPNRQNSTSNSSRSARPPRSSNSNSSCGSPSMPPPRQTKTLAAMREKLRAKRMLKESERSIVGQRFYGLPGSMTPHPSSGSSGYFQNRNYSTPVNFTPLGETENKQSPSMSSPPLRTPISPSANDGSVHSVNVSSLQSENQEITRPNLASESPCSPLSAPSINVMSPLPSVNNASSENITTTTNNNLDNYTYCSNSFAQSYPSSPHLSNSNASIVLQHSVFSQLPSPMHPTKTHRFEQSVSAPPTPSNVQSGQNFTNYLHQPGHSFSSIGPCSSSSAPLHTSQVSPTASFGSYPSPVFGGKSSVPSSVRASTSDSYSSQIVTQPVSGSSCPTSSISSVVSEAIVPSKSFCQALPILMEPTTCPVQATVKSIPSLDTISISPLTSVSSVTKLLTSNSHQSRSSTTTRAFFVDGDNLSEAVAFLQSLNPKATITQQQFLLIPGANKSQMILCRAPVTCSSEIISPVATQTSVSVSRANLTSWSKNVSHITTSSTTSVGNTHITVPTSVVPNDVSLPTNVTERSSTSCSTPFFEPYRSNNFYATQCSSDSSFPKLMKTSELQIPRSLVYSKSINVPSSNGSSFPLNILISHPKALEASSERTSLLQVVKSVSSPSKVAIPSSANSVSCSSRTSVPTVLNYKQPVSHSQLNVSLLTPGPSVINNEVPILFVQDRNQHPIRSQTPTRPVNWVQRSSFDQHTDLTDRSTISLPILSTATVITTHANNTGEFRCFSHPVARSGPSMQLSNNGSVSSHFGFQPIQSVQPSNPTGKSLDCTPFLSGPTATIMSPCLPAVILSHPITIQSTSNITPSQQNIFNRSLP
ncbi:unnamed protein product [Schistosoma bovis]|nr:unnamed protein product [Schistosoma bovis]CAH8653410.1 unnamed protein product [Schistosoma bovis]CAH8653416.1 unnamed protein product [Schistosoma bovis]